MLACEGKDEGGEGGEGWLDYFIYWGSVTISNKLIILFLLCLGI